MTYRTAAAREAEPRNERVLTFRRYGAAWVGAVSAAGAAMLLFGVLMYARLAIRCERAAPEAAPRCALAREHVFWTSSDAIVALDVKEAHRNDDEGTRPYLVVDLQGAPMEWLDLGARNQEVLGAYRAYLDARAPHFEATVRRDLAIPLGCVPMGALMILMVLFLERRQRIAVDMDEGTIRVTSRGLLGGAKEASYPLAAVEEVDFEQQGDGEIYAIALTLGGHREVIATAMHEAASEAVTLIKGTRAAHRAARERAEKARARTAPRP